MKEKKKPSSKRILVYYLILAASILVVAAITVSIVFAVNRRNDHTLDNPNNGSVDDGNKPNPPDENPDDNNPPDTDVDANYKFISPVANVEVYRVIEVFKNESIKDLYYEHSGFDFKADAGTEVYSALDGEIVEIGTNELDGGMVAVQHGNGTKTVYKFLKLNDSLKKGDKVKQGDVLGTVAEACGNEHADGAHLHFEVYENGELSDPEKHLGYSGK